MAGKLVDLEKLHESIWATRLGVGTGMSMSSLDVTAVGEVVAATMQEIQRGEVTARTGLSDADAYAELASLIVHAVSS